MRNLRPYRKPGPNMDVSRDDKTKMAHAAINDVLGMADGKKLKSVKIKIKFDGGEKKMAAVRKKAVSFGASSASGDKGATR